MKTRPTGAPAQPADGPPHAPPDTSAATTDGPPGSRPQQQRAPAEQSARRPWSARHVAAAVTAALIGLAAGLLLFEAVWTQTGHRANAWWRTVSGQLATRPVDDVWILTGAAIAAALGLVLVVLALAPGLRRRLPLRVPGETPGPMGAELDRKGAALLLRDAAMRVPGVSAARVRLGRRRVRVRADVGFRASSEVAADLAEAVRSEARDRLGLARPPKPVIRIHHGPA